MALKIVLVLATVLYAVSALTEDDLARQSRAAEVKEDIITKRVKELIEKLKGQMKEGLPEAGVPPLDPLVIPGLDLAPLKLGHIARLNKAKFDNTKVTGLPDFTLEHIKTSIVSQKVNLTLHFPQLNIDGEYEIDGMFISILPIFGKGAFHVRVKNVQAGGNAKIGASDGKLSLKSLELHVAIESVDIKLNGLLGGEDLGNEMGGLVQKTGNLLVRNLAPKLAKLFSDFAREKINNALKNMDIGGIVG